jgi:hypothetical protein
MHADLSRVTYRPDRRFSSVLAQQGRVQLDADLNEQALIHLDQIRSLAADLIGRDGGPLGRSGFDVTHVAARGEPDDLTISAGRYYVDGIVCDATRPAPGVPVPDGGPLREQEEASAWTYWDQPDGHLDPERPEDRLPTDFPYLAYLRVWERSVTAAEDPALREVALGPAVPDTAARLKVVWQVLAVPAGDLEGLGDDPDGDAVREAFFGWADRQHTPTMAARARRPDDADDDPCPVDPDASYRGPENQLYRVEIHDGGSGDEATLKWSRENGSVVFGVDAVDETWVDLASLGIDDKLDLTVGDWVEVVDVAYASRLEPLPLRRIEEVDLPARRVRLSEEPDRGVGRRPDLHPYLRRWDQTGAPVPLTPGRWMPLEDGVEVYFPEGEAAYRTGDHWLVPARAVTGDVDWPTDRARRPLMLAPAGIDLHHAPLAWVTGDGARVDLRPAFPPLTTIGTPAPADNGDAGKPVPVERTADERPVAKRPATKRATKSSSRTSRP